MRDIAEAVGIAPGGIYNHFGSKEQLALEAELQSEAARTEDFREGVAAFLEKRPARFQGR